MNNPPSPVLAAHIHPTPQTLAPSGPKSQSRLLSPTSFVLREPNPFHPAYTRRRDRDVLRPRDRPATGQPIRRFVLILPFWGFHLFPVFQDPFSWAHPTPLQRQKVSQIRYGASRTRARASELYPYVTAPSRKKKLNALRVSFPPNPHTNATSTVTSFEFLLPVLLISYLGSLENLDALSELSCSAPLSRTKEQLPLPNFLAPLKSYIA
jgi:hypothetical protein